MTTHSQAPKLRPRRRTQPTARSNRRGITLLEMTVVILVLLSMAGIMFLGARTWKNSADRSSCILNISYMQKGVRGYANLYGYDAGSTVPGLKDKIIGSGCFVETTPRCPGEGTYTYGGTAGADVVPAFGTLYMECSLSGSHEHDPPSTSDW